MSNQPLDKGRLVATVDQYQARQNGQDQFNQDGTPKMKNKYMAIGEATEWPDDNGGSYVVIKQFLNPPALPCETRIFWDSENANAQSTGQQYQQQPQSQQMQQPHQQGNPHQQPEMPTDPRYGGGQYQQR